MIEINNKEQFTELVKSNKYVIAYFSATWCGPCKAFKPHMEEMSKNNPNLAVAYIDVDALSELAKDYEIRSVPTSVYIKDGTVTLRFSGGLSPSALNVRVKSFLES